MNLSELMNRFRTASRELFNNHFRPESAWGSSSEAWELEERFGIVEDKLFEMMLCECLEPPMVEYI